MKIINASAAAAPAVAPKAAPEAALSRPFLIRIPVSESPTITLTSCSSISVRAVGFIFCLPWKYPLYAERSDTRKIAGAIDLTAFTASGFPI